jgi:hypothetical protein
MGESALEALQSARDIEKFARIIDHSAHDLYENYNNLAKITEQGESAYAKQLFELSDDKIPPTPLEVMKSYISCSSPGMCLFSLFRSGEKPIKEFL